MNAILAMIVGTGIPSLLLFSIIFSGVPEKLFLILTCNNNQESQKSITEVEI